MRNYFKRFTGFKIRQRLILSITALFFCSLIPSAYASPRASVESAMQKANVYFNDGKHYLPHYEEAFNIYQSYADKAIAQYRLGWMYYHGLGTQQDYQEAFKWFQKAVAQGNAQAQYNLGLCYFEGKGIAENKQEAFQWFQKAVSSKYHSKEAIDFFQKIAQEGDIRYQVLLADTYFNGKKYEDAYVCYMQAAQKGNADAQFGLGVMYDDNGYKKDYQEAFNWYKKAAAQGHAQALFALGVMYKERKIWVKLKYNGKDVSQEELMSSLIKKGATQKEAYDWGQKFALAGYQEAFKWFQKAAAQGHAQAQYNVGVMYFGGQVVKKDYLEAFKWFQKAANQGFIDAYQALGGMYYKGTGVKQSYQEAFNWYLKSLEKHLKLLEAIRYSDSGGYEEMRAEQHEEEKITKLKDAVKNIAEKIGPKAIYEEGLLLCESEKYISAGFDLLKEATLKLYPDALYKVGLMYYYDGSYSEDYTPNSEEGLKWLQRAADQGHEGAKEALLKIKGQ
jgi:TPR repeat protein